MKNQKKQTLYKKSGIYSITNTITNQVYIGSSKCLGSRLKNHLYCLIKNKHVNTYLQNSFNKYGKDLFVFNLVEECLIEDLLIREQYYLDTLKPEFNICKKTSAPMEGRKHSEETKKKFKNRKVWNKGIPRTEEEKNLMSIRKKEEFAKKSEEWYKKRSEIGKLTSPKYWLGKKMPETAIEKMKANAKKLWQKIKCLNNGKIYNNQLEAANDLKIKQGHISEVLNKKRKSASGYFFERVVEDV